MISEILIVTSVCIDAFFAAFSYGLGKIKIPALSVGIIAVFGAFAMMLPLLFSDFFARVVPEWLCPWIGFVIFFILGIIKVFDSLIKKILRKNSGNLHINKGGFVLEIYLDETKADKDQSKILSPKEAVSLATVLSVDCFAGGFGAMFLDPPIALLASFVLILVEGFISVVLGEFLGKVVRKRPSGKELDLTWLGGVIMLVIAFSRVV
jgi:putative sporulation protein YtaF